MAGRTDWVNQHQQGIVVAIRRNAHHVEKVAGGFPFGPQTLFGPRIKGHFTALFGLRQRILIHIAQHQDFAGDGVLYDGRHHAVGFFPVQLFS